MVKPTPSQIIAVLLALTLAGDIEARPTQEPAQGPTQDQVQMYYQSGAQAKQIM